MTGMTLPRHKTRIVATIGPASESPEMLERQITGRMAMLVTGPHDRNLDADYQIQFIHIGGGRRPA